jgi:hypothetical protein
MIVMIIHRISDADSRRCKAPGEAGKNSAAQIFWRGNRPEPACQPEFFRCRVVDRQQPIAGFEDVEQRTLNIQVAMYVRFAEAQRAHVTEDTAHDVWCANDQLKVRRAVPLGWPLLPIPQLNGKFSRAQMRENCSQE